MIVKCPVLLIFFSVTILSQTLTLHEAYTALVNNNLELRTALLDVKKASAGVNEANASWYPSLDAKAQYQWQSEKNSINLNMPYLPGEHTIGRQDRTELGLDCSWPVFTGFTRTAATRTAREQVHLLTIQRDAVRQRLAFSLGVLYLQWLQCEKEITLKNALCQQLSVYVAQSTAQFEAGVALKARLLDAAARLRFAEVDKAAALARTDSLRIEIEALVNSSFPATKPDTTTNQQLFVNRIKNIALDTARPELELFNIRINQLLISENMLDSRRYPQLFAVAGLRYANPGLAMGSDAFMGYGIIGMNCTWNLFDGFRLAAQKQQLAIGRESFSLQKKQRTDDYSKTFSLALSDINRTTDRLQAAQAATAAAQALATDLENSLSSGTVTQAEQLNAVVAAHQAALVEEQLKTAREIAALKLLYAAGKELVF